jgi:hypothetical protein
MARRSLLVLASSPMLALTWGQALAQLPAGFPATVNMPAAARVGLATNAANTQIWDSDLANWTNPLMANGVRTTFAFGQCFGGGMLDRLQANAAANGRAFSGTSASSWNEFAYYRGAGGAASDWVDTYTAASWGLFAPRHDTTAGGAWRNDPFGTAPGQRAMETAQYRENGAGGALTLSSSPRANRYAVLYSGGPNAIDWDQLNTMYTLLTTPIVGYNYDPSKIFILSGNGVGDAGYAGLPGGSALLTAPNVLPADKMLLQNTLAGMAGLNGNDQLLFLANDHGVIQAPGGRILRVPKRESDYPSYPPSYQPLPGYPGSTMGDLGYMFDLSDPMNWQVRADFAQYQVTPTPGALALLGLGTLIGTRRRRM